MKLPIHLSLSGALAGLAVYRELWTEIPGTGCSAIELVKAGVSRIDLLRFVPSTAIQAVLVVISGLLAGYAVRSMSKEKHDSSIRKLG